MRIKSWCLPLGMAAACFVLRVATADQAQPVHGCGVVVDGRIQDAEWRSAKRIALAQGVTMLVLDSGDMLCLGFQTSAAGSRYLDLFIARPGVIYNLHASMRLGQRELPLAGWSDTSPAWTWDNNTSWTANRVLPRADARADAGFAQQVEPYEGFELVMKRREWQPDAPVRIEIRDFEGKLPDVLWPATSTRAEVKSWQPLPSLRAPDSGAKP